MPAKSELFLPAAQLEMPKQYKKVGCLYAWIRIKPRSKTFHRSINPTFADVCQRTILFHLQHSQLEVEVLDPPICKHRVKIKVLIIALMCMIQTVDNWSWQMCLLFRLLLVE